MSTIRRATWRSSWPADASEMRPGSSLTSMSMRSPRSSACSTIRLGAWRRASATSSDVRTSRLARLPRQAQRLARSEMNWRACPGARGVGSYWRISSLCASFGGASVVMSTRDWYPRPTPDKHRRIGSVFGWPPVARPANEELPDRRLARFSTGPPVRRSPISQPISVPSAVVAVHSACGSGVTWLGAKRRVDQTIGPGGRVAGCDRELVPAATGPNRLEV